MKVVIQDKTYDYDTLPDAAKDIIRFIQQKNDEIQLSSYTIDKLEQDLIDVLAEEEHQETEIPN